MFRGVECLTDIGRMREENQDACSWKAIGESIFFLVVADGMGGYAGGSLASTTVVESIITEISNLTEDQIREKPILHIGKAINVANANVNRKAREQVAFKDMGSTCVCALVIDSALYVAHIGDSRAYLLREGEILLTTQATEF
jgi:serine/threonine protein phosphatase PrpC